MDRQAAQAIETASGLTLFDRGSALSLLNAASVSPSTAHRLASISLATATLHHRREDGQQLATVNDLPTLLTAGGNLLQYSGLESDEPLDVRKRVGARWGRDLFLLAPGGWERPVSIIEEARLACSAFDPTLDRQLGFGLFDLVELTLRHMHEVLTLLGDYWPDDQVLPDEDAAEVISPEEVAAAVEAPSIAHAASRCSDPTRAARALRWASCTPSKLTADPTSPSGVFGPVIAVRRGSTYEALPVGFMIDGLYSAIESLRSVALKNQAARTRWKHVGREHVLRLLTARNNRLADKVDVGTGEILALQPIGDDLLLAVDIALADLDEFGIEQASERLRAVVPGATLRTPRGPITLDNKEIIRLVVVVGTSSLAIFHGDDAQPVSILPAEDLRWILTTSGRHDDLPLFLLDWQTPRPERTFSFGAFDQWEVWKGNGGAFHKLGAPLSSLMFSPHHERAEWDRCAELMWLELSAYWLACRSGYDLTCRSPAVAIMACVVPVAPADP